MNVIKLFDEVTVHIAVLMYKFKNQLLPTNFNGFFFTSINETNNYNSRLSSRRTYALPKQEQSMEFLILDIKVLRSGMPSVITLSFCHLIDLRKS